MNAENSDQIIEMLDSIDAAIGEASWGPVTVPPPSVVPDAPAPIAAVPEALPLPVAAAPALRAERRVYPDPPPRPAGGGGAVKGTAAEVLARFKWGTER